MSTNTKVKKIEASEGHIITNGKIYGRVITLSINLKEEDFYEITEEEYEKLFPKEDPIENDIEL
jgi:hypothetical protein